MLEELLFTWEALGGGEEVGVFGAAGVVVRIEEGGEGFVVFGGVGGLEGG